MVKRIIAAVVVASALVLAPITLSAQGGPFPAAIEQFWQLISVGGRSFINLSVIANGYISFGTTLGTSGYGFRDNGGVIEVKSSGGAWAPIVSGSGGTVACASGGTGITSYAVGDLIYASAAPCTLSRLADVASGSVLVSGGVGVAPSWSTTPTVTKVLVGDGTAAAPGYSFASETNSGRYRAGSGDIRESIGGSDVFRFVTDAAVLTASNYLGWGSSGVTSADLKLYRDAANTLALRNSTNAQTFNVYKSTDGTNKEYAPLGWSGNNFLITTAAAGSGTVRSINIYPGTGGTLRFGADGADRWNVLTTGAMVPSTTNLYDFGSSSAVVSSGWFKTLYVRKANGSGGTVGATASSSILITDMGQPNDLGQIGMGYASSSTYQPIAVYAKTTDASGNTKASFNIAIRSVTTDTAPTTVFTLNPDATASWFSDSTHGYMVSAATDGTVQFYTRAGADGAVVRSNSIYATTGFGIQSKVDTSSSSTGLLNITNWAATAGVQFDLTTDGTLFVKTRGAADSAIVKAATATFAAYNFNGTSGKTGATCSAFTAGGCTTSPEPTVYVTDYLVPWFNSAGFHVLTNDEYADFQAMRAQWRGFTKGQ